MAEPNIFINEPTCLPESPDNVLAGFFQDSTGRDVRSIQWLIHPDKTAEFVIHMEHEGATYEARIPLTRL